MSSGELQAAEREYADAVLATDGLTVTLGAIRALHDVTLKIAPLTISGIIGPNGAGKSTLLNAVSGLVPVASGDIYLSAMRVTGRPPHEMARLGLGRSFQGVKFIRGLSVVENVMTGDHLGNTSSFAGSVLRTRRARRLEKSLGNGRLTPCARSVSNGPLRARSTSFHSAYRSGSMSRARSSASRPVCSSTSRSPGSLWQRSTRSPRWSSS